MSQLNERPFAEIWATAQRARSLYLRALLRRLDLRAAGLGSISRVFEHFLEKIRKINRLSGARPRASTSREPVT